MTRDHAALQLLAHGPLTRAEFIAITGWPRSSCTDVILRLRNAGRVRLGRSAGFAVWSLATPEAVQ